MKIEQKRPPASNCPASVNGHKPYWNPQKERRCWDCGARLSDD